MDEKGKETIIPESSQSTPQFLRQFSKRYFSEERQELVKEIRAKRKEFFDRKEGVINKLEDLNTTEDEIAGAATHRREFSALSAQTQGMLRNFYDEQAKVWAESAYTTKDVRKYFTESHLSSLSFDEYITLLRRFPNQMVTHVTRQGFRDHFGHSGHTGGMAQFHNNFIELLQDGWIRSSFGSMMVSREKEKAVAKYLELFHYSGRKDAREFFSNIFRHNSELNGFPDSMAVHFATEQVADVYYGGESGNEIFFAFPALLIASQYYFRGYIEGTPEEYRRNPSASKWNDLWVWANEEKGVPINAGIVFIPSDAKVDRKTGSKYATDEFGKPIINIHYVNELKKIISSPVFRSAVNHLLYGRDFGEEKRLEMFRETLLQKFGISDEALQEAVLDERSISSLNQISYQLEDIELIDETIRDLLLRTGLYLKLAEDIVDSKDFWENFFAQNHDLKPSKVVYYEDGDPSQALYRFREKNGLVKRTENEGLGFPKRKILKAEDSKVPRRGFKRFRSLIYQIIDDLYQEDKT